MWGWVMGFTSGLTRSEMGAFFAHLPRNGVDGVKFLRRFDVKHQYSRGKRIFYFIDALPHTGIDNFLGIRTGLARPVQFSSGHDIHAPPIVDKGLQDCNIGIGLCGKAYQVRHFGEGLIKHPVVPLHCFQTV